MKVLARHLRGLSSEEIANLEQPLRSVLSSTVPDTVSDRYENYLADVCVLLQRDIGMVLIKGRRQDWDGLYLPVLWSHTGTTISTPLSAPSV